MSVLRRLFYKQRKFYGDDFDWDNYTEDSYARRTDEVGQTNTQFAHNGHLSFDAATGVVHTQDPPAHPNVLTILEAIGQLQPSSVHEVGCGGGDHLANAAGLYPEISFSGGDRSSSQLAFAQSRHGFAEGQTFLQDLTMPFSRHWPKADLVYSQAVIMHIHTAVSHFVALTNMVNIANEYVLLMENQQCHNFVQDVVGLRDGGHFNWDTCHIYLFDGSHGPKAMLLSRQELQGYVELTSDEQLRNGQKASQRRLKRSNEDSDRATFGPVA